MHENEKKKISSTILFSVSVKLKCTVLLWKLGPFLGHIVQHIILLE